MTVLTHTPTPRAAAPLGLDREAVIDRRDPAAVATARFFAAACGWDWHLAQADLNSILLAVSELVTNAIRHAAWPAGQHTVRLRLALVGRRATIEVHDPDPVLPTWPTGHRWDNAVVDDPARPAPGTAELAGPAEGLRGLPIVSALIGGDLAAFTEPGGKVVRATVTAGIR